MDMRTHTHPRNLFYHLCALARQHAYTLLKSLIHRRVRVHMHTHTHTHTLTHTHTHTHPHTHKHIHTSAHT